MYRHTVTVLARLKLVTEFEFQIALMPEIRVIQIGNVAGIAFEQHLFFKAEQIRRFTASGFPPRIKMATRHHFGTDTLVIELKQLFIINQNIAATRFVF
ncbi:Uncharacterised protein [Vibrio cholerae]|uniref:Uncharacterized protein n=1 Tax=Vibrio cholerae TaxID=666 RepID=A0A655WGY4_VIBCL|nr:Uncharacterised protein [Vibrio cholerae]